MSRMKIAVMTKKRWGFFEKFERILKGKGHTVQALDLSNLVIDQRFLEYDLVVLKSKQLFFLYAGFYAKSHGIPVIPDPEMCQKISNRLEFPFVARKAGISTPNFYVGFPDTLEHQLSEDHFPLVLKRIVGTGSKGVEMVSSMDELTFNDNRFLYLEEYISGQHLLVFFIDEEIAVFEKEPFVNEHHPVKLLPLDSDIEDTVRRWRKETGLRFGHLDLIRECGTGGLVLVDPGAFPQFLHWKGAPEMVARICLEYQSQSKE